MQIGVTFGVWDLFHYGHLRFLERAKKYCDRLIVGICSDNLTSLTKGDAICHEQQRAEIVQAIKCVSGVFIYSNTDYEEYFRQHDGTILIVGEDFGNQGIPAHNRILASAPNIIRIERTPNISTTKIKERISECQTQSVSG